MKHLITVILLLIFLGLAGYSIYQVSQFNAESDEGINVTTHNHPINNKNISNIIVSDMNNKKTKIKTHLNHKITIINFWASWCGPCNEEMPELVQYDEEKPNHVGLIGMNVQDNDENREAFIEKYNATYPMLILGENQMKKNKINNVPTTIFVDKNGKVLKTYVGELSRKKLDIILDGIN
ncbi:TlpA family protein disulfide reductase [Macrococcus animalis]|uniref:TlpA family protein disulfide reductase n=1 Tax=Macrococcus animalis TaxID=3395467 RepID=UPI0039BE6ACF